MQKLYNNISLAPLCKGFICMHVSSSLEQATAAFELNSVKILKPDDFQHQHWHMHS